MVYLEMTFCVLACFINFNVFFFDEIDVEGPKIVYEHIRVRIFCANIPTD